MVAPSRWERGWIGGKAGMGRAVKRGVLVLGLLCAQIGASAAQSERRTFASPALRTVGVGDPYAVGAPAASPTEADVAPGLGDGQETARPQARSAPVQLPAVSPPPPSAAAVGQATPEAQSQTKAVRKPTPQWPLTAEDIEDRRRQKQASGSGGTAAPAPASIWPATEVTIAKARCTTLLKDIAAVYIPMEPVREGDCGTPAPVQLMAVGKNPQVVISPPAVVTCDLVAALAGWLHKDIQPSARKHLGSPIVKIENMSSYSCRNAYGRAKTRLSEHGRANALDIRGFVTASGHGPEVLADWGPIMRDVRASEIAAARAAAARAAAARVEAARVEAARQTVDNGVRQPVQTGTIPGGVGTLIEGVPQVRVLSPPRKPEDGGSAATFAPVTRLGGPGGEKSPTVGGGETAGKVAAAPEPPVTAESARRQHFLREAHISACRTFATVLGPEANNAHRNHFHIDMAERGSGAFCE